MGFYSNVFIGVWVGIFMTLWSYSEGNMPGYAPRMMIDRVIASAPDKIEIGVTGQKKQEGNPMSEQVIRINNGDLKSLVSFVETSNSLVYEFEGNIVLKLMKRDNNEVMYHIKTPDFQSTRIMSTLIRKFWSPISLKSNEFDKIASFIQMK